MKFTARKVKFYEFFKIKWLGSLIWYSNESKTRRMFAVVDERFRSSQIMNVLRFTTVPTQTDEVNHGCPSYSVKWSRYRFYRIWIFMSLFDFLNFVLRSNVFYAALLLQLSPICYLQFSNSPTQHGHGGSWTLEAYFRSSYVVQFWLLW